MSNCSMRSTVAGLHSNVSYPSHWKVDFETIISTKTQVFGSRVKVFILSKQKSNTLIKSNFSQTCQFSISFYEALAEKPKLIFRFHEIIASAQSLDSR